MDKVVEKNEDGTLTEAQAERYMLNIALVTKKAFASFAEMTPEEILQTFRKPDECEAFTKVVDQVFKDTVEADLPQVFNEYIDKMAGTVCEKTFKTVAEKSNDNLTSLIETLTGIPYEDMSPKDVITQIEKLEEAK
jgi:hypothetical protein